MASAKQIKARKLFAMRSKRGDFRKAITKTKKSSTVVIQRKAGGDRIERWRRMGISEAQIKELNKVGKKMEKARRKKYP